MKNALAYFGKVKITTIKIFKVYAHNKKRDRQKRKRIDLTMIQKTKTNP